MRVTVMERKESERLLQGLQQFANLGDSVEDFQRLSEAWRDFFPVLMRNWRESTLTLAWSEQTRPLVLAMRDLLRSVWRTGSKRDLALLLGFGRDAHQIMNERSTPDALDQMLGTPTLRLCEAMKQIPSEYIPDFVEAYADWGRGEFQYEPKNSFQKALHLLWRQSWRAKSCWRCRKYFVGDKPAQMYCSVKCYSAEKKERGRTWWSEHGEAWRAKRQKGKSRAISKSKPPRRTKR
jgi:hypothetical protein